MFYCNKNIFNFFKKIKIQIFNHHNTDLFQTN
ncbi:hypothetical protein CCO1331 [Campylobacter coli RM2228]|nr:hypothetical protein CCO1331 [Campylobacter coli RM2228]